MPCCSQSSTGHRLLFFTQLSLVSIFLQLYLNFVVPISDSIRWVCGVKLNKRKNSEELRELLRLEPVSLLMKKSRMRGFGHIEQKDYNDWVKCCITWEVEGIKETGRLKKTWWDCVRNGMFRPVPKGCTFQA